MTQRPVYVTGATLGTGTLILADQSVACDTRIAAPAYAGGADAWVIALERQARGLGRPMLGYQVRARRDHARNDTLTEIALATSVWPRDIDLGGSAAFGGGRRFQWRTSQTTPVQGEVRTLAVGSNAYRALDVAFDTRTAWHWCVAWRDGNSELHVSRVGHDGFVAESAQLTSGTPRGTAAPSSTT